MRTFGFALAAVLCAVQLTVALPRPDFGIDIAVFSSDRTDTVASSVAELLAELWNTDAVSLTANYDVLGDLVDEVNTIGSDFSGKVTTLFSTISDLANADSNVVNSFAAVGSAIDALYTYFESDISANFDILDGLLPNNDIISMLLDAFGTMSSTLSDLEDALDALQSDIEEVVSEAGTGPITKALLRSILRPSKTTELTIQVQKAKADLPLVFYILMKTKELAKMADDYILASGDAASSALDYIDTGLSALADEVESYSQATSDIQSIVDDVSEPNLDFGTLDLSVISDIEDETVSFSDVYVDYFQETIGAMQSHYSEYKAAIPGVSDGYSDFYSNDGCGHIYDLVTVLINFGPYAEYCFEKYGDQGLALFEENARRANECVDREITRLLKLQEVLVSIAEQLTFSIEDLLDTVSVCFDNADYCNASIIDEYLHNLHSAAQDNMDVLEGIVDSETDAGLARLNACFTASKYGMLLEIGDLQSSIGGCEQYGPD